LGIDCLTIIVFISWSISIIKIKTYRIDHHSPIKLWLFRWLWSRVTKTSILPLILYSTKCEYKKLYCLARYAQLYNMHDIYHLLFLVLVKTFHSNIKIKLCYSPGFNILWGRSVGIPRFCHLVRYLKVYTVNQLSERYYELSFCESFTLVTLQCSMYLTVVNIRTWLLFVSNRVKYCLPFCESFPS